MPDERCRITVVGERRRVDLALPARAPLAEFLPDLTRLCGQPGDDELPAAWSLARPGNRPFALSSSLDEEGVVDGAVLYLRDLVEGELDSPVVTDLEELVAEAADDGRLWNRRTRAASVLGVGLLVLVAGVVALAVRLPHDSAAVGLAAAATGVALPRPRG